ncbi:MAG: hypothetical protein R3B06_16435 [Kofleriaceae bacterium]
MRPPTSGRPNLGTVIAACAAAWLAAACADDASPPPPAAHPPTAPAVADPAFTIDGVTAWNLIGNALTPGDDQLVLTVAAPADVAVVDVWVDDGPGQRLIRTAGAPQFTGTVAIAGLGPGDHTLTFGADSADVGFAAVGFVRTHPLYFMVSTDWDFSDPGQFALDAHDRLRADHPDIRFTQFVGPYTYTDPMVTDARKAELTTWLTTRRDAHGDEIGLHIHPWCHFVVAAGLPCITDQSTLYQTDVTGYTVKVAAYGETDFATLLRAADDIFTARGLGKPVTFRAGGWTASAETMRALAATGYVADTSANNWARMEEWNRPGGYGFYGWNMMAWSTIGDTSQPYYPNVDDAQAATPPRVPLLEVPDNAIMVDYVTTQEMKDIFAANWPGGALAAPTTFMMGFHPSANFDQTELARVDGILDHADRYLASRHQGPVVYEILRNLPTVWQVPN